MNSRYIKSTLILLTIGLSLLTFNRLISQELTLKTGHVIEKRVLKGYTQTVSIGNVRGTMQWQLSTDGTTWLDLSGKTQNTLSTTVTVTIYLRCAIKEPICDVVYSDVLNLIPFDLPIVTTGTISNISGTSATAGGTVVSDENSTILARGVCWAITRNPSTSNSYTTNGSGVGTFTSSITGLTTNTTYYVRAYASNLVGTSYGAEASFRTSGTLPTVTTTAISGITNISAVGGGNVTGDGSSTVTARGVCWSTAQNPTTANTKTTDGTGTGVFTSNLTGLTFTTIYYVRAYAVNSSGTAYGDQVSFTTYGNLPVVTTTPVTNVTASGATSGGNVTSTGGTAITARGVCWSLTQNPTIANPKTTDGTGSGVFVSNITGLSPNTPYYVRAYATNSTGTVYGSEHTFMTRMSVPLVTTAVITNISNISATGGGNVTSDGGTPVTERGVCWAITHNPTTAATKTVDGAGLGAFVSSLTALTPNTIYYVRAYAINSEGTSYGTEVTFKTNISVTPPLVTTAAITNITTITATGGGNVTSDGNSTVTSRGVCWSTSENPTTENNITTNGAGLGEFISNLTALTPNTTYYVRAYASNSFGKTYGEQVSFKTSPTLPAVTTTVITGITTTTATGGGNVTNDGGTPVTARGVCWSAATVPTTADTKTSDGTGSGSFTSSLTGLTGNTTYYARAYSTNSAGTSYGNEVTFKTSPVLSTVTTVAVTGITQVGATSGGNVTNDGGSVITSRGVCWSTLQNPTIANSLTSDGTGTGAFVSTLAGLTGNTTYYIRAYSTNSVGTSYGSEISFKTSPLQPTLTTTAITAITQATASSGGNITSDGGAAVTMRGVCWSTVTGPTTADSKTTNGAGSGSYPSNITGLTGNVTYFVRAYATNIVGTTYGNELSFKSGPLMPVVTTTAITAISQTAASSGGNVTFETGAAITARGICWSTSANPTIADSKTTDGTGVGVFTSALSGLSAGTAYFVRAYATNSVGTGYGEQQQFTTDGTFTYSGRTYAFKNIGTQIWMVENLAYLPSVSTSATGSETDPYYYVYDYQGTIAVDAKATTNYATYGVLYNYAAALTACPTGWHLPSDTEWTTLTYFLGTFAGGKMKETGTINWLTPNEGATNTSGFTALPAGYRDENGTFTGINRHANFTSSTKSGLSSAWYRNLYYYLGDASRLDYNLSGGFSVRCVKN